MNFGHRAPALGRCGSTPELTETRYKQEADPTFHYTNYAYDKNGNLETRWDNGTGTRNGREHDLAYDESDQVLLDHDWGPDLGQNTADDTQVGFEYWLTGWQQQRAIDRWDDVTHEWRRKQTVDSTYFDNGDLKTVQTHNGAATPALLESHTIEYIDDGIYLNGNRTQDTFHLQGSQDTDCDTEECVTSYGYGPRENLTSEKTQRPSTNPLTQERTYGYDLAMNLNHEKDSPGGYEFWYTHAGNRLTTRRTQQAPDAGVDRRYFYDEWGNLTCVTTGTGSNPDCARPFGIPVPGELLESYTWDYLDRLDHATHFATMDDADYEHDPLNRVAKETETHDNGVGNRRTCFRYQGLSSDVSDEAWVSTGDPCTANPTTTKSYSYDANDERVGMKKTGLPDEGDYYYARNLHTDVSLLEKDTPNGGEVTASYAYKPYGAEDSLSSGDPESPQVLNAFRFNDRRLDSGSLTLDMGARRYSGRLGRFVQMDFLDVATDDLDLAMEGSTQNRYAFAGGNPVGFVETDGHVFISLQRGDEGVPYALNVDVFFLRPRDRLRGRYVCDTSLACIGRRNVGTVARVYADFHKWSSENGGCPDNRRCGLWNFFVGMKIFVGWGPQAYKHAVSQRRWGHSNCNIYYSQPARTNCNSTYDGRLYADVIYGRHFWKLPGKWFRAHMSINAEFNFSRYNLRDRPILHGKYVGWAIPKSCWGGSCF